MSIGRTEERELFDALRASGLAVIATCWSSASCPWLGSSPAGTRAAPSRSRTSSKWQASRSSGPSTALTHTRGTAFSSYAVPSIAGAIKRHFRDHGWSVRVPRELQELSLRVERLSRELDAATGRPPSRRRSPRAPASRSSRWSRRAWPTARFTPIRSIHHGALMRTMTATRWSTRWEAPTRTSTACSSAPTWTP